MSSTLYPNISVASSWLRLMPQVAVARPALCTVFLCFAYIVPGLVGHDPWKQDETYVTGIIHHIAQTKDWVVPTNAGQPFMEKPPLYFVVAQQTAELLAPWFPMHDGARLSNVLWMAVVLVCLGQAARAWGERSRRAPIAALVTLLSCVGLVLQAHSLLVDVALLAGFAVALLGFCNILDRPVRGAALLGTGAGIGFLAKGLIALGCLGVTALLLPLLFQPWRRRSYFKALAIAAVVALPWVTIWPAALYARDEGLFDQWFWQQNLGRFFGYAHFGANPEPWYYARTLPWFAFPALPLALWTLWRRRTAWRNDPPLQLCVMLTLVIITALSVAGSMRAIYLLPVLLPLSLLAAAEVDRLPEAMQHYSFWAAHVLYGTAVLALWGMCLLIAIAGAPPAWLLLDRILPLSSIPRAGAPAVAIAIAATMGWLACVYWLRRSALRAILGWTLGLTLTWILVATLWLPWINEAKSYGAMFDEMEDYFPSEYDCVATYHLGESEAAMLHYQAGIVATPLESKPDAQCQLLLAQGTQTQPPDLGRAAGPAIWSGHRAGDTKELFVLYQRLSE